MAGALMPVPCRTVVDSRSPLTRSLHKRSSSSPTHSECSRAYVLTECVLRIDSLLNVPTPKPGKGGHVPDSCTGRRSWCKDFEEKCSVPVCR